MTNWRKGSMDGTTNKPVKVFCSYAPQDEKWLRKLEAHLRPFCHQRPISLSYNQHSSPGDNRTQNIHKLGAASVILLLISVSFFESSDCEIEMKHALERQKKGEARVIPILV